MCIWVCQYYNMVDASCMLCNCMKFKTRISGFHFFKQLRRFMGFRLAWIMWHVWLRAAPPLPSLSLPFPFKINTARSSAFVFMLITLLVILTSKIYCLFLESKAVSFSNFIREWTGMRVSSLSLECCLTLSNLDMELSLHLVQTILS